MIYLLKYYVFIWLLDIDPNDQIYLDRTLPENKAWQKPSFCFLAEFLKVPFCFCRYENGLPTYDVPPYIPQPHPFETQQKPNTQQEIMIANDNEKYTTITQAKITA